MATAREKFKFQNTLLCLLKGLIGRKVVVELRNEHSVVGTIEDVDWLMNTSMTHARYTTPDGRIMAFEQFYIQGRNIRFVQIPNYVDIMETINTELRKFQGGRGTKRKENWISKQRSKQKLKHRVERAEQRLIQRLQSLASDSVHSGTSDPDSDYYQRSRGRGKAFEKTS